MTDQHWSQWIIHYGEKVPVPSGTVVFVSRASGREHEGIVSGSHNTGWIWSYCRAIGRPQDAVLRYRVRRPAALIELIKLAECPQAAPAREHEVA